jgi:hypothetical protein
MRACQIHGALRAEGARQPEVKFLSQGVHPILSARGAQRVRASQAKSSPVLTSFSPKLRFTSDKNQAKSSPVLTRFSPKPTLQIKQKSSNPIVKIAKIKQSQDQS